MVKKYSKEAISFEELKRFLRINGNHEDDLIETLLDSAIAYAECFIGANIVKKEIKLKGKYSGKIKLQIPILSIICTRPNRTGKDLKFVLEGNIVSVDAKNDEMIEVAYIVGNEAEDIPADLKTAIMLHVSALYECSGENIKIPGIVLEIYSRYKSFHF